MKTFNKLFLGFAISLGTLTFAQEVYAMPETMKAPPGGGGVVGPEQPSSPIDMYVYALMIAAMIFIVFYKRFTTAQRIN